VVAFFILGVFFVALFAVGLIRAITASRAQAIRRIAEIETYGSAPAGLSAPLPREMPASRMSILATRIGSLVVRLVGGVRESDLHAELLAAGIYTTSPRTLLGYRVLAAIVLPALVLVIASGSGLAIVLALVMVAVGWMLPLVVVRRMARKRKDEIDHALPELVDLLVVTVEAGLGFSSALRVAADQFGGPLHDELRLALQEQAMGLSMGDALLRLVRRADTPGMGSFVRSVTQGESLGVSTGTIMRNLAVEMRKRRRKAAEERAHKAPIKLLFPLVFLIFPAMFVVLLLPAILTLQSLLSS
jgi:tight adherence protein C